MEVPGHGLLLLGRYAKSAYEPIVAHQAGAYPGFYSMKRLGVFRYFPLWMGMHASPSQGYPPALSSTVSIYTPGWREGDVSRIER